MNEKVTVRYKKSGMKNYLQSFFYDRFGLKIKRNKVVFKSEEEARAAFNFIENETMILDWGYEFKLKGKKLYFTMTEQINTFVDELKKDPDYVENRRKFYENKQDN